jgi:hypothetical protein
MLQSALLFLALAAQQPAQQPAAAPAKPTVAAQQQADTSKAKTRRHRARKAKAGTTTAPHDTTKSKP